MDWSTKPNEVPDNKKNIDQMPKLDINKKPYKVFWNLFFIHSYWAYIQTKPIIDANNHTFWRASIAKTKNAKAKPVITLILVNFPFPKSSFNFLKIS